MPHLDEHVVICNWNERAATLVRTLHPRIFDQDKENWHPIVVISESVQSFPNDPAFEDTLLLPGSPLDSVLLARANIQDATSILIVADYSTPEPDDKTLLIALAIRELLPTLPIHFARTEPVRIAAEVVDATKAGYFRNTAITGIHEVICEGDLCLRILAQTNISPGLTFLFTSLLEYSDDTSEIYQIRVPDKWKGKELSSFADLHDLVYGDFERVNEGSIPILLGIARADGNGERRFIINPSMTKLVTEGIHELTNEDRIIVLSRNKLDARSFFERRGIAASEVQ